MEKAPVDFLYTNIGRGHPNYLDGIVSCLPSCRHGSLDDVFSLSRGAGRLAWHVARYLYRLGPSLNGLEGIYSRLRRGVNFERRGPMMKAMGGALAERYAHRTGPLVVAHPLLVALLHQHSNLLYQHGELAVPREAVVPGDHRVLVPDAHAASVFIRSGIAEGKISVTGLCIEPTLVAKAKKSFNARMERFAQLSSLGVALYASGAEPRRHVDSLAAAAISVSKEGHSVFLFARQDGRFHRSARHRFRLAGLPLDEQSADGTPSGSPAVCCLYRTREELNALTARCFDRFDMVVAPSHERTLWAMGLGLPMLILEPAIGTFAPLNRERMIREGVGIPLGLAAARELGPALEGMQAEGKLTTMAEAGWGRYDRNGFQNIADMLG